MTSQAQSERGKASHLAMRRCVIAFPAFSLAYMYISVYRGRRKIDHFLTQPCGG